MGAVQRRAAPDVLAAERSPALRLERAGPAGEPTTASAGRTVEFDATFRAVYPALHRYLQRMTGDADTADDIAQEAFFRLLSRPMPQDEARLWLFTVATNLFRDGARTVKRRERLLTAVPPTTGTLPAPDEELERSQSVARVRAALSQLPARERQMLLMKQEGFRYEEIARVAAVAPSSVGTLLARALRRFAAVYDAHEEEMDDARR
ncbi:MAG TPA: sigma-70 family RNA polymerase sigma factor [Longimicrobiaceae bacterium]|jgi:RNA polymerase sigma-70 factor (ECF subfamily)|nr:sigma-70 family RNA polymerase sigma factor [Longimicrobiaceae bacterium]